MTPFNVIQTKHCSYDLTGPARAEEAGGQWSIIAPTAAGDRCIALVADKDQAALLVEYINNAPIKHQTAIGAVALVRRVA